MRSEILRRICQSPTSAYVAHKSTPVISFGNFERARIGTLGINPSSNEFYSKDKLFAPDKKRLVDLESLEITSHKQITEGKAQEVLEGCYNYFNTRPLKWFDDFERLLNAKSFSYRDGSASHIDLVQWCTIPVWRDIPSFERRRLLEFDRDFFHWQIENNDMQVIILGGRQVLNEVQAIPGTKLDLVSKHHYFSKNRKVSYDIYKMDDFKGRKLVGWSVNLQTMRASIEEKTGVTSNLQRFLEAEV